jgi:hypothetical protein
VAVQGAVRSWRTCIRDRIRLEGSDLSVFKSEYLTFDTVSISKYLNYIFIISISNHILSDRVDFIYF